MDFHQRFADGEPILKTCRHAPESLRRLSYPHCATYNDIKVIARDRLASCLLEEVREKHPDAVTVRFGVECTSAKWLELHGGTGGTLTLEKSHTSPLTTSASEIPASSSTSGSDRKGAEQHEELTAELVIAADGVRSAIRDGLEGDRQLTRTLSGGEEVRVKKFPKSNDFVYKVVPFKLDQGWRWAESF